MKEVISGKDLRIIMQEAIDFICEAVGSTIGPTGNNVIINIDNESPYITNDGVTIANAISSSDKKINTILEIIKEASFKTNEKVGDGTTTTLVLLQSIFNEGINALEMGINPITLKKELDLILDVIISKIKQMGMLPTKEDFLAIATISTNDKEMGIFLANIFEKMNNRYAIRLEESDNENTYYEIKKGYDIEVDNIPNIYFQKTKSITLNDVCILIINGYLDNLENIAEIINEGLNRNKNILILASDYEESLNEQVILYFIQMNRNIYLFKLPDYGSRKEAIEEDIAILTNSKIKNINYENISFSDLGFAKEVIIKKDNITIINDIDISKRIDILKDDFDNSHDDYEKEFLSNRISKLENGIATIYVGGKTKPEKKEKLMRFEDGLCALEIAKEGILPGEGITLLSISNNLSNDNIASKIMRNSLQEPFTKIMENSLGEYEELKKSIIESNFNLIYNFDNNKLENIKDTKIIDPMNVTIEALKNATSIAGMLLTTNYMVINENIEIDKNIL